MSQHDQKINFSYRGVLPASKSLLNRAFIIQSFFPNLEILGDSNCEDVVFMKKAIADFKDGKQIDCGSAGTVLRFMALRVSREKGQFSLTGTRRLFERPHDELHYLAEQLGFEVEIKSSEILINSSGWKPKSETIQLHSHKTSQFLSGLFLSSWNLPFNLDFELAGSQISESYFNMTLKIIKKLGHLLEVKEKNRFSILPNVKISSDKITIESDSSSAFSIAVLAALSGNLVVEQFDKDQWQPDSHFPQILKSMNVPNFIEGNALHVNTAIDLKPININISNNPDLFPSLCVLCAFADGVSTIFGAPHLVHKESNRIVKTREILDKMGVQSEIKPDGIVIYGNKKLDRVSFALDPDHDHRIAMVAGILMKLGYQIQLQDRQVVNKSFPEFWDVIGINK